MFKHCVQCFLLILLAASALHGATTDWTGGAANGLWDDAGNWNNGVPGADDTVGVDLGSNSSIDIDLGSGDTAAINFITISGTGTLTINSTGSHALTLSSGSVVFTVPTGATVILNVDLSQGVNALEFQGGGTVILNNDSSASFDGTVTISDATVELKNLNGLGSTTGGTTLSDAAAVLNISDLNGTVQEVFNVTHASAAIHIDVSESDALVLSGAHTGAAAATLTKTGNGSLSFSGASAWDINIDLTDGTAGISGGADTGDGTLTVSAGALLDVIGSGSAADLVISSGGKLLINNASDLTTDSLFLAAAAIVEMFIDDDGDESDGDNGIIAVSDLTLDGVFIVTGGTYDTGSDYTVFTYSNSLTDNEMDISITPVLKSSFVNDTAPNPDEVLLRLGNRAPVLSGTTLNAVEDTDLVMSSAMLGYSDGDADPLDHLEVVAVPANGQLYIDLDNDGVVDDASEALVPAETVTGAQVNAGQFKFKPEADMNGAAYDSFQLLANDGTTDSSAASYIVDVTAVNDAPSAINASVSTAVSTNYTFASANFGFDDSVDSGSLASITVSTLPANGILENNGAEVLGGDLPLLMTVSDLDTDNDLVFVPNPGSSGSPYDSFQFTVNDGSLDSLNTAVMTVNVLGNFISWDDGSNNDAWDHNSGKNWDPDGIPGTDSNLIIDSAAVDQEIDMNVNSNPIASIQLTGSGDIVILSEGGTLVFSSSATISIPSGVTFIVQCPIDIQSDGTLTVTGGGALQLNADSGVPILNDTIVIGAGVTLTGAGTVGNVTLQDGGKISPAGSGTRGVLSMNNLTCSTTSIIVMELDDDGSTLDDDRIAVAGSLTMDGFLDIDRTAGSLDQTNTYELFTLSAAPSGNFTVQMPDGGTPPGSIQASASAVDLLVGNQPPTVTGSSFSTTEDVDTPISTAHLGYSDGEGDPLDFITITAITAAAGGFFYNDANSNTVYEGGEELSVSDSVSAADIAAGRLRYHPATNDTNNGSISFTANDDIGNTSISSATVTISIIAQNDPPVINSTPVLTATDNVLYTYTIVVSDPEDPDNSLTVTAPTQPAWIVNLIDNGDGTWTFSGTPSSSELGNHSVEIQVEDSGNATDTQNFVINVSDGNAQPILPDFGTFNSVIKNTPRVFSYNDILTHTGASDPDGDPLTFVIISLGTGTLETYPGLGPVNVNDTLSSGQSWRWTPPTDVELSTETAFSIRVRDDSALGNGITRDFDIFVDTVDLPPEQIFLGTNNTGIVQVDTLTDKAIQGIELYYYDPEDSGGPGYHFAGQPGFTDPYPAKTTQPASEASVTYTIKAHLDSNVGDFFLGGSATPLGVNDTFTQEDIMNGNLVYKHVGDQFDGSGGDDQFTFDIDDGNGNVTAGVVLNMDIVFSALAPTVDLFSQGVGGADPGTFFFNENASITATFSAGTDATQLFRVPRVFNGLSDYSAGGGGEMIISILDGQADPGDNFYIVPGTGWWFGANTISLSSNQVIYHDNVFTLTSNTIGSIDSVENGQGGQALRITWTGHAVFPIPSREIINDLLSRVAYRYIGDDPPSETRRIQVAISDNNGVFGFGTRDLVINASNDAPNPISGSTVVLTTTDGSSVRAVFNLTDPDNPSDDLVLREVAGQEHNPATGDLSINDPFAGAIDYEHFNGNPGDSFQLEVYDGVAASPATTIDIQVVVIDIDGPTLESDPPVEVEEGVNFFYTPVVDDLWESNNGGAGSGYNFSLAGQVPVGLTINGSNQLQWIDPDPQESKTASFGLIIRHIDSGKIGFQPIIITVKEDLAGGG